jgi:hypothetical protein
MSMASMETLSSLAMLKVKVDGGSDYLDYLRPFVHQVLFEHKPDPVTDRVISEFIRSDFGLDIPTRTVQIVLKRLSIKLPLERVNDGYRIKGQIPDRGLLRKKSEAARHISSIVLGILDFDQSGRRLLDGEEAAVGAICAFLNEFNVACLQSHLRGTAIPLVENQGQSHLVLVSEYVLHLQKYDPDRFSSFMVLVQGHMLANALLAPDLKDAPKTFKRVTFFLDTPLLVQSLGLEGPLKEKAINELISLLRRLGGRIAAFSHSNEELVKVIRGAADHIENQKGRGAIVFEARRNNTTKSDLLLLGEKLDDLLEEKGISIEKTPAYSAEFQIDEVAFQTFLEDEISYFNPRAKEYDINSVRSVIALRGNSYPSTIEKAKAVFVTSNAGFARAAYEYSKDPTEPTAVSSVITDFALANMAWLKAPMGAPNIPMTELLSYSYAAFRPTDKFLDRFLWEVEKLQKNGRISERDHQLLRSSVLVQDELMQLTLGDETYITEETISETLRRVETDIRQEESGKVKIEQEAHDRTRKERDEARQRIETIQERAYWEAARLAKLCSLTVSVSIAIILIIGVIAGFGIKREHPFFGWFLFVCLAVLGFGSLMNMFWGTSLRQVYSFLHEKCQGYLWKRKLKGLGFDLTDTR